MCICSKIYNKHYITLVNNMLSVIREHADKQVSISTPPHKHTVPVHTLDGSTIREQDGGGAVSAQRHCTRIPEMRLAQCNKVCSLDIQVKHVQPNAGKQRVYRAKERVWHAELLGMINNTATVVKKKRAASWSKVWKELQLQTKPVL